jgi:hypothetical protein
MREDPNPNLAATLNVAGHSLAGSFNLAAGNALALLAYQAEAAVGQFVQGRGYTTVNTTFANLTKLSARRHQHNRVPSGLFTIDHLPFSSDLPGSICHWLDKKSAINVKCKLLNVNWNDGVMTRLPHPCKSKL